MRLTDVLPLVLMQLHAFNICFVEGRDPLRSAFVIFPHFICCSHMLTRKAANGAVYSYHLACTS